MTYQLFNLPPQQPLSAAGRVLPGSKLYFYLTTTTTPTPVYTTSALSVAHSQPLIADGGGRFAAVYLDPAIEYKATVTDANDVLLYTIDPVNDQLLSGEAIGEYLYEQTEAETSADTTPSFYIYTPSPKIDPRRYGAVLDNSTDSSLALSSAIAVAKVSGGCILIPEGSGLYCAESVLIDGAGVDIEGTGENSLIRFAAEKQLGITASRVGLHRLRIQGPDAGALSARATDSVVYIRGTSGSFIDRIDVDHCHISNARAAGLLTRYIQNFRLSNNSLEDIGYTGISIESCNDGSVIGNRVDDVNVTAGNENAYGVTLTRDAGSDPVCKRIAVTGNVVTDVPSWTAYDQHGGEDVSWVGNVGKNCLFGLHIGAGDTEGIADAPVRVSATGNTLDGTYGDDNGCGIVISGSTDVVGSPADYAESISVCGNVVSRFGWESDNIGAVLMQAVKNATVVGNTLVEPRRHGISMAGDCQGFTISGNTCVDPHGSAGAPSFVRISADYHKGFIGGNSLIRGSLSASEVCATFVSRSGSTYTNSDIDWDYNYSQHTGSDFYSNPDTGNGEFASMRRSTDGSGSYTGTLTGCTTSPTGTIEWRKTGDVVTLYIPSITATSNTTAATVTGMPAAIRPTSSQSSYCKTVDNGTIAGASATIDSGGTLTLHRNADPASTFTSSGTKGVQATSYQYSLR